LVPLSCTPVAELKGIGHARYGVRAEHKIELSIDPLEDFAF
jgi:hypothetical protein